MKKLTNLHFNKRFLNISGAAVVFASRFGFLPANVSPLGSFGYFSRQFGWYFLSIIAFDVLRGGFYPGFLFTYLGFLMYPLFGFFAGKSMRKRSILLPLASLSFFLVSNFGVWLSWYPHTLEGLISCYTLALPFYRNTLIGDGLFGGSMLIYQLLKEQRTLSFISNKLGFSL